MGATQPPLSWANVEDAIIGAVSNWTHTSYPKAEEWVSANLRIDTFVNDTVTSNLVAIECGVVVFYWLLFTCTSPSMVNCCVFNCYNPLRFEYHASWMYHAMMVVRGTLRVIAIIGMWWIVGIELCRRGLCRAFCEWNSSSPPLTVVGTWLGFSSVIGLLYYLLCKSVPYRRPHRMHDIDERLLHLRIRSDAGSIGAVGEEESEYDGDEILGDDDRRAARRHRCRVSRPTVRISRSCSTVTDGIDTRSRVKYRRGREDFSESGDEESGIDIDPPNSNGTRFEEYAQARKDAISTVPRDSLPPNSRSAGGEANAVATAIGNIIHENAGSDHPDNESSEQDVGETNTDDAVRAPKQIHQGENLRG